MFTVCSLLSAVSSQCQKCC